MTISVEQAQTSLKELIEMIARGETVLITLNQRPVAELIPITAAEPKPVFGSCKGMLTILADDDGHLDDFKEYMG